MIRDDLSNKLIHFTKGTPENAESAFYSIVSQKKLIGGTGYIKGSFHCICFTESPITKIPYVFSDPDFPYAPLGIMVDKKWLYSQGGRPVIYQSDDEYTLLHSDQKYRHKRYNPLENIDYTWEREWRIQIDELSLDPNQTTLIVPNRKWVEDFKNIHTSQLKQTSMVFGDDGYLMIHNLPWHFIALEDLGVPIDWG